MTKNKSTDVNGLPTQWEPFANHVEQFRIKPGVPPATKYRKCYEAERFDRWMTYRDASYENQEK